MAKNTSNQLENQKRKESRNHAKKMLIGPEDRIKRQKYMVIYRERKRKELQELKEQVQQQQQQEIKT